MHTVSLHVNRFLHTFETPTPLVDGLKVPDTHGTLACDVNADDSISNVGSDTNDMIGINGTGGAPSHGEESTLEHHNSIAENTRSMSVQLYVHLC